MYGIVSLRSHGPSARCGFKFVNFLPRPAVNHESSSMRYRGTDYSFTDGKLYFQLSERCISRESMISMSLNKCKFLSGQVKTKDGGQRKVVLSASTFEPYPIVRKDRFSGHSIAFCESDAIIYHEDGKVECTGNVKPDKPLENLDENSRKYLANKLDDWPHDVINQDDTNMWHLQRFQKKYYRAFLQHGVVVTNFKNIDVIDVNHIDEIQCTDVNVLKKSNTYELFNNRVDFKGTGLSKYVFSSLDSKKKFLFMLVECDQHRISIEPDGTKKLVIHTDIPMSNKLKLGREMLWLKMDKYSNLRLMQDFIISSL